MNTRMTSEIEKGVGQGPHGMDLLDWFAGQLMTRPGTNAADAYAGAMAAMDSRKEVHRRILERVKEYEASVK